MIEGDPLASLFAPFPASAASRPFVVAQLGQSLDGRIATATGAADIIGGPAALDHLHRLRAHADAVVVGIGTVLADDPQLTVRRVAGRNPVRVVIDPRGRLPASARCLDPGTGGCLVITSRGGRDAPPISSAGGAEMIVLPAQDGRIAPAAIVAALFARGLRKILVEGGSRTISGFIDAGCIDRLHVAVAPLIIGSGQQALELRPVGIGEALRPATRVYMLSDGNVLFDCDLRSPPGAAATGAIPTG